ncbi:MAG: hypothetical protein M1827_006206 [Pycnora praestabilis]|nr:MAG: hypothetical protein M1827_006206 [Pycnora praestabilis]
MPDAQASVYEALDAAGTKPSDRVGVVGIGGLGHMAILSWSRVQFAKAMGCHVTAFSCTPSKREDTLTLGASEFYVVPRGEDVEPVKPDQEVGEEINVLLLCTNELPNLELASTEASRSNHIAMLSFAARHGIKPWIEEFPMTAEGVTRAFERLEVGQMRFRGVLIRQNE